MRELVERARELITLAYTAHVDGYDLIVMIDKLCKAIEIDKMWRCSRCESFAITTVGMGYIRCDKCHKLSN